MAGATSLIELILKKWGDDIAGAAKELEEKVGFPESVANRIATGELPMDAESVAKRAQGQGYGETMLHGSSAGGYNRTHDIKKIDPEKAGDKWGQDREGFFLTNDPVEADYYATTDSMGRTVDGTVYPLKYKSDSPKVISSADDIDLASEQPVGYWDERHGELISEAKANGNDSISLLDYGPYEDKSHKMTVVLNPNNIRSPNAAFDPEYTGSNIMGGLALPAAAGLLAAGQSEDADAGPLSKAAKKIADGWDEATWLAENPRPHPDVKIKDHTPEQRSDYKRWEYEKSKAKAGPAQVREISDAEALWLENNPRPDGDPRTHPRVKTWMNQRSMVRNGQLDPTKSNPTGKLSDEEWAERKARSAERRGERRRRYASEYRKNNKGYHNAQGAKYRAAKLQRTPEYAENDAINEIYNQASLLSEATGTPYQVDHVIPLQGDNVSGLHVPGNLMIVPDKLNTSKSNAFTPGPDPMRFNDVAQRNITEQNTQGLLDSIGKQRGAASPELLGLLVGGSTAALAAPMVKDSGMISSPRSETLFDLTMGARDLERRLEGSPASLLFPSGLVEYLETVNRREEDPNAMTRGMALLDVLPF